MAHDILIVDDEADIRTLISGTLEDEGMGTRTAANADEAFAALKARLPSLVILDIWLQGSRMDGLQILAQIKREQPHLPVIVISGHGTIETALAAIRQGAYDFIEKPFKSDKLLVLIERAIETARLKRENEELRLRAGSVSDLTGKSPGLTLIRQTIEKVAPTGSRVLISGPPGTGKEVVARQIHLKSRRAEGPFVAINCASLDPARFEVELFGTETGEAHQPRKIGAFEQAHGGTLLLDEVADMPYETQGKIVRVLQDQMFERVGGTTRVQVDVRVIATTNRDLQAEIAIGRFRQDLYYRLSVVPIAVPPLAARREDIPALARQFLARSAAAAGIATPDLSEDALAALQAYEWPGNARQLRNAMEWVLIMANNATAAESAGARDAESRAETRQDGAAQQASLAASGPIVIRADQLPPEIVSGAPAVLSWDRSGEIMTLPLRDARELFEREYLLAQVTRFGGNISRTAIFIGMERSALHRKLKTLGVHGSGINQPQTGQSQGQPISVAGSSVNDGAALGMSLASSPLPDSVIGSGSEKIN